jgi:hypothetical protein
VMQKKNIWVYKRLQAPPYSLGGHYHRERLTRTRRISTRILQLGRWEDSILEPILEKLSTIASRATPIRSAGRAPDKILVSKNNNKESGRRLSSICNSLKSLPLVGSVY